MNPKALKLNAGRSESPTLLGPSSPQAIAALTRASQPDTQLPLESKHTFPAVCGQGLSGYLAGTLR